MRKYRVYWECRKSGFIDFEVDSHSDLEYEVGQVHDPSGEYDFYEDTSENEVVSIERLVPQLIIEVELTGLITFANMTPGRFTWQWQPEFDKKYLESVSIKQCFCVLPGGDV